VTLLVKKRLTIILFLILLIPLIYSNYASVISLQEEIEIQQPLLHADDEPLIITTDIELELESSAGTGTKNDPFMLDNLEIDTLAQEGILIQDTTKYFLIVNCTVGGNNYDILIDNVAAGTALIRNCTLISGWHGVGILNSDNNTVMDCIVNVSPSSGIYIYNASNTLVYDNRIYTCGKGIYVVDSYSVDIFFNEIYDSTYDSGILAENSDDVTVQYNICDGGITDGITISSCTDAYVGLNNCTDNLQHGVSIEYSEYSLIEKNKFIDCDLGVYADSVEDLLTYDVYLDNTINDEEIYYSENDYMIDLPGWVQKYPQIILVNASNVNIIGQDAFAPNIFKPLLIQYGWDLTIQDCYFEKSSAGVHVGDCDNVKVIDCSFIDVGGAIGLQRTNNSLIQFNTIVNATYLGISLADANFNIIKDNHLENMAFYAISVSGSSNVIYHNNFINCSIFYSSYGYDTGVNNYWYNETLQEGNYWDNWSGTGTYAIGGSAGAIDLYPLGGIVVIPELGKIGSLLFLVSILSFISVLVIKRKRK